MTIQIELISESELADESFNIVINGLKPRETYRVEMYLTDYYCINAPMLLAHDVLWRSTGTFVSDKNGIIDISQTPSCSGSYEGISTMGLFSNAKPLTKSCRMVTFPLSNGRGWRPLSSGASSLVPGFSYQSYSIAISIGFSAFNVFVSSLGSVFL